MDVTKNQTEFRLTGAAGSCRINCRQHLLSAQNISVVQTEEPQWDSINFLCGKCNICMRQLFTVQRFD